MAGIAGTAGRDMGNRLAKCIHIVVAVSANLALNIGRRMAERHRSPAYVASAMTGFTRRGRLNMGQRLGQRVHGGVTPAVACHTGLTGGYTVIHAGRLESRIIVVAAIALRGSRNVGGRFA